MIAPRRATEVVPTLFFGDDRPRLPRSEGELPEAYIAHIQDAHVYTGSSLVIAKETALYDDVALDWLPGYSTKLSYPDADIDKDVLTINAPLDFNFDYALNLCDGATCNYFHFFIETLPRLVLADSFPEWREYPILIEGDLPKQLEDALNLMNVHKRPIFRITRFCHAHVDNLVIPAKPGLQRENYERRHQFKHDFVFAHDYADEIRRLLVLESPRRDRMLYISRKDGRYRKLLNEEEIETYMIRLGFEIVRPELLSFEAQRHLFSQASVICGPSGSGISNMFLAPPETQILILVSNNERIDYYYWSQIADKLGHRLATVIGPEIPGSADDIKWQAHNHYTVPLEAIESALSRLCEGRVKLEGL